MQFRKSIYLLYFIIFYNKKIVVNIVFETVFMSKMTSFTRKYLYKTKADPTNRPKSTVRNATSLLFLHRSILIWRLEWAIAKCLEPA